MGVPKIDGICLFVQSYVSVICVNMEVFSSFWCWFWSLLAFGSFNYFIFSPKLFFWGHHLSTKMVTGWICAFLSVPNLNSFICSSSAPILAYLIPREDSPVVVGVTSPALPLVWIPDFTPGHVRSSSPTIGGMVSRYWWGYLLSLKKKAWLIYVHPWFVLLSNILFAYCCSRNFLPHI